MYFCIVSLRSDVESALVCAFVEDTEPGSSDRLLQEVVAGLLGAAGGCRLVHAQLAVRRLSLNMWVAAAHRVSCIHTHTCFFNCCMKNMTFKIILRCNWRCEGCWACMILSFFTAGISKYSGGALHYFPGMHVNSNPAESDRFVSTLRRYVTRKIGFESVMRIRCSRGQ